MNKSLRCKPASSNAKSPHNLLPRSVKGFSKFHEILRRTIIGESSHRTFLVDWLCGFSHLEIYFWHVELPPIPTVHHPLPFPSERCRSKSIMSAMGLCIDKFNWETCCFLVPGVWIKKTLLQMFQKHQVGNWTFWSFSKSIFNCMAVEIFTERVYLDDG